MILYYYIIIFINISATCDVKREIYGLVYNKFDTQIAIVENMGEFPAYRNHALDCTM